MKRILVLLLMVVMLFSVVMTSASAYTSHAYADIAARHVASQMEMVGAYRSAAAQLYLKY